MFLICCPLTLFCARGVRQIALCAAGIRYGSLPLAKPFPFEQSLGDAATFVILRINAILVNHTETTHKHSAPKYYLGYCCIPHRRAAKHSKNVWWSFHILYYHQSKERALAIEVITIAHRLAKLGCMKNHLGGPPSHSPNNIQHIWPIGIGNGEGGSIGNSKHFEHCAGKFHA